MTPRNKLKGHICVMLSTLLLRLSWPHFITASLLGSSTLSKCTQLKVSLLADEENTSNSSFFKQFKKLNALNVDVNLPSGIAQFNTWIEHYILSLLSAFQTISKCLLSLILVWKGWTVLEGFGQHGHSFWQFKPLLWLSALVSLV